MSKKDIISIIGLGYVGLPLLYSLSNNYRVIGFDVDKKRIYELKEGYDSNKDTSIKKYNKKNILFTNNDTNLKKANIHIITVPTPIFKNNLPDLSFIIKSSKTVSKHLKMGDIIVYESTVYPGLVEEICGPLIEKTSRLNLNKDFHLGYSPERVNPGDKNRTIEKINKIVSASNKKTLKKLFEIYSSFLLAEVIPVSSIKVAEAAKVIENTQRDVNIALINEFSVIFNKMGLDTEEVLNAASTKWNFISGFKPGLVGGHCIGIDPYYLAYKSKKLGVKPNIILSGRNLNDSMYKIIGKRILKIHKNRCNRPPKILILGITFKKNCSDIRNSQLIRLCNYLKPHSEKLYVYDEYAKVNYKLNGEIKLLKSLNKITRPDIIVVGVNHKYTKNFINKNKELLKKKNNFIFQIEKTFTNSSEFELINI